MQFWSSKIVCFCLSRLSFLTHNDFHKQLTERCRLCTQASLCIPTAVKAVFFVLVVSTVPVCLPTLPEAMMLNHAGDYGNVLVIKVQGINLEAACYRDIVSIMLQTLFDKQCPMQVAFD